MKRFCFVVLILLGIFVQSIRSQSIVADTQNKLFSEDTLLSLILNKIPEGWIVSADSNRISFQYKDSVWILNENRASLNNLTKEQLSARVKEKGKRSTCYLIFSYEPKWSFNKIQDIKIKNSFYREDLNKLAQKYEISRLEDKSQSSRFHKVYKAGNISDQKILDAYMKEKEGIEKKIIKLPDYHSSKYSLFLREMKGYNDNETIILPQEASLYLFTIKNMFDEICGH
jgi:hypothetical protein